MDSFASATPERRQRIVQMIRRVSGHVFPCHDEMAIAENGPHQNIQRIILSSEQFSIIVVFVLVPVEGIRRTLSPHEHVAMKSGKPTREMHQEFVEVSATVCRGDRAEMKCVAPCEGIGSH